jgi:hypothetical protein
MQPDHLRLDLARQRDLLKGMLDRRLSALTYLGAGHSTVLFGAIAWESRGFATAGITLYLYCPWRFRKGPTTMLESGDFRAGGAPCRTKASSIFAGERLGTYIHPRIEGDVTAITWNGEDLVLQFGADWYLEILGSRKSTGALFDLSLPLMEIVEFARISEGPAKP